MKKIAIALGLLISTSTLSFAQTQTDFQKFITNTFEEKLDHIQSAQDLPEFLKSFSKDLEWKDVNVSIDGRIEAMPMGTKADLEKNVSKLAARPDIRMEWDILEYTELTKRENSYVATMNVKVSLFASGELIRTGTNNVQIVAIKKNDFFEIIYMDILQISNEQYLGACYVRISNEQEKSFQVDVAYPNGNEYKNFSSQVTVIDVADPFKKIIINNNNKAFYWNPKNEEVSLTKEGQVVGKASTIENVLLVVVKTQGSEACSSVIRTSMKRD